MTSTVVAVLTPLLATTVVLIDRAARRLKRALIHHAVSRWILMGACADQYEAYEADW